MIQRDSYSIPNTGIFPNIAVGTFITSQLCLRDLHTISKTSKDNRNYIQSVALERLNNSKLTPINLGLYPIENLIEYFGVDRCSQILNLNLSNAIYFNINDKDIENIANTFGNNEKLFIGKTTITHQASQYFSKMSKLKEIKIIGHYADTNLEFLKHLTELTTLELTEITGIKNLQFLNTLHKLKRIKISQFGRIQDYAFLEGLTNLTSLNIHFNRRTTVDSIPFRSLSNLTSLNASFNKIKDLSYLNNLKKLTHLNLFNCTIKSNFDYLQFFTTIEKLNLASCRLKLGSSSDYPTDVGFLNKLPKLTSLDLSLLNTITNFNFLKSLSELTYLALSTKRSDLNLLQGMKLTHLKLERCTLDDFSVLHSFQNLSSLNLSRSNIVDISFQQNLTTLKSIDLSYCTDITDFNPLQNLVNLTSLNVSDTLIVDANFMQNLTNLKKIDLSYCIHLTDIRSLHNLTNLTDLNLRVTKIVDISILKDLPKLAKLCLERCEDIRNLSLILSFPNLQNVDIFDKDLLEALKLKGIKFF